MLSELGLSVAGSKHSKEDDLRRDGLYCLCEILFDARPHNVVHACVVAVRHCRPGEFQCDNFNCTLPFKLCDGADDCGDATDERNCETRDCEPGLFRCNNGRCIPTAWLCDQTEDCLDGSDELPINANCRAFSTPFSRT